MTFGCCQVYVQPQVLARLFSPANVAEYSSSAAAFWNRVSVAGACRWSRCRVLLSRHGIFPTQRYCGRDQGGRTFQKVAKPLRMPVRLLRWAVGWKYWPRGMLGASTMH